MDVQHNISQDNPKEPKNSSRKHKAKHDDSECNGNTISWNGKRCNCIQGNNNNHDRTDNPGGNCCFPNNQSPDNTRSEEHTSELQSRGHLVCRLLLEKKKKKTT